MYFSKTTAELTRLPPNLRLGIGSHLVRREEVGRIGNVAADTEFAHGEHTAADINPVSFLGEVLGQHYSRQVQPGRQLQTNVILGNFEQDSDPRIVLKKERVAATISRLLHQDLSQSSDRVRLFTLPGANTDGIDEQRTRFTRLNSDKDASDLCRRGLTIMISDFSRFQPEDVAVAPAIGVIVNHQLERKLPANIGVLSLGSGYEVDTSKVSQLDDINSRLAQRHQTLTDQLTGLGMSVANIIATPREVEGFNHSVADNSMAEAVARLR